jgi:hypothetical protein
MGSLHHGIYIATWQVAACVQELKAANEAVVHFTRQLGRFKKFVLKYMRRFYQLQKLKASVAAAHAEARTAFIMKIRSSTRSATKAFTILRSQANSSTQAVAGGVFSSILISAQQAADLQWKALLKDTVARCVVDRSTLYMRTFDTGQQIFQAIVRARVREQQDYARQFCGERLNRCMRAATAVSDCWAHVLQKSRRMAAALASIVSSQKHVHIHLCCLRALRDEIEVVAAINASDAAPRHTPGATALPLLMSSAQDTDYMATAVTECERAFPSGSEHAQRAAHTSSRMKPAVN